MVKPFYVDTTGAWVLGHNQENGEGSQLQAGARAELIPSAITEALSTFGGRLAAQTMQYMYRGNVKGLLNYAAFRPYAMMEAIKSAIGDSKQGKTVLNPAGGYSPVFYWLAKELTETNFIEIDVAKTIDFKKQALAPYGIPANLEFQAVDLKTSHLHEILTGNVDVIIVPGAYVSHNDYRDMLRYIKNVLKDDGCVIASFPDKSGIEFFVENSTVFSRIVSNPKGAIENASEFPAIFKDTGFKVKRVIKLSELAKKYGKPVPTDIEVIAIATPGEDEIMEEDEFDILADLDITQSTSGHGVPPFIDFDPDTFKRFPRRTRRRLPDIKL